MPAAKIPRPLLRQSVSSHEFGQQLPKLVDIPSRMAKESVVVREMAVANGVTGDNQVGDIPMTRRSDPASHQQPESFKTWLGEDGRKCQ